MTAEADRFFMGVALDLARRGLGRTSPNPPVGCVVAREGRIIGRGFHPAAGEPHAEVFALEEAGEAARGADLYVTLEPCSHHGRTPPCADRVMGAGIRRAVVATEDPNPRVAGRGVTRLRQAGIAVEVGVGGAESRRLLEAFGVSIRHGRSFVHLKLAATLDGKIATRTGDSRWITGAESRLRVHRLRDRCGAVVVGVGTAAADDPRLTVRLPDRAERRIGRFVLDPTLRVPPHLGLLAPDEAPWTVLVCREDADPARAAAFERAGAEVLRLPAGPSGLDLGALLRETYRRGRMEVLVEGGGETARAFLDARLVDRVHLYLGLRLLGGRDAVPMLGGTSPERIDQALGLEEVEVERVAEDLYVTGIPAGG